MNSVGEYPTSSPSVSMAKTSPQVSSELFAARTEAFQQARATNVLKTILLIIVMVAAFILAARYVATRSIAPTSATAMANEAMILHKLIDLEKQIADLKTDIDIARKPNPFAQALQSVAKFAISNWVLLSFLVAMLTALYVKVKFKIDYFESYRDLSAKKMLSEFYRILGDRMMISSEWDAAESAYRDSLAINPTNIKATYGIAKVGVFQPLKGQKNYASEVADTKLDYLIANPPPNASREDLRRDFAQLYFLKGLNRSKAGDEVEGRSWQLKAIDTDPTFVGPHLELGYIHEAAGEIEQAVECYKRAVALDPNLALANNNLGNIYLIMCEFDQAIEYLTRAYKSSETLLTTLALGEAYAYARQFDRALVCHRKALSKLDIREIEKERYVQFGSPWLYNFMPLNKGDLETIKLSVKIRSFEEKKMLTLYVVALDHALLGNIQRANERFAEALASKEAEDYFKLFLNRIQSMLKLINPDPPARSWFEEKATQLSTTTALPSTLWARVFRKTRSLLSRPRPGWGA